MKRILAVYIIVAIIALVIGLYSFTGFFVSDSSFYVKRVIDGDTIELLSGERVRLLGIDTPERGQHFYKESKSRLKELVENRNVILEYDVTDKDKYDRLLRYVFIDNIFVNNILVKEGYAEVLIIPPDEKYQGILFESEAQAKESKTGVWKFMNIPDVFCVGIHYLHYNAYGNDNENLNDEYVTLRNKCVYPVPLSGWKLKDNATNEYIFPKFVIENKTTVILHTGSGTDNQTDLFWNKKRSVWNNAGDRLILYDKSGNIMIDYEY